MQPKVQGFFDEPTNTVSYVIKDPQSMACAIIDPVLDYDPASGRTSAISAQKIAAFIESNKLQTEWILETHAHADHVTAAPYLKERLGGKIGIGANITIVQKVFGKVFNAGPGFRQDGSQFDTLFDDGAVIGIGGLRGRAIHTPGHTPACMTYIFGDAAFVGDTLFMPDYGTARCDFPGGDAGQLYRSIQIIFAMPPETRLFLCHDYLPLRPHGLSMGGDGRRAASPQYSHPRWRCRGRIRRDSQEARCHAQNASAHYSFRANQHAGRTASARRRQWRHLSQDTREPTLKTHRRRNS